MASGWDTSLQLQVLLSVVLFSGNIEWTAPLPLLIRRSLLLAMWPYLLSPTSMPPSWHLGIQACRLQVHSCQVYIRIITQRKDSGVSWMCIGRYSMSGIKTSPVFTPPVIIQAPVVTAALIRPLPSNCLMRGWSSNFCVPPWTETTSLGNSMCHSLSISCRMASGLVSYDNRTY